VVQAETEDSEDSSASEKNDEKQETDLETEVEDEEPVAQPKKLRGRMVAEASTKSSRSSLVYPCLRSCRLGRIVMIQALRTSLAFLTTLPAFRMTSTPSQREPIRVPSMHTQ
jgi:hypothetical protein